MNQVHFRFYEELNDHLPEEMRKGWVETSVKKGTSLGEKIRLYGIPLEEIDLVLVNQQPQTFDYLLQNGDQVSVYPVFETFDISEVNKLRNKPLRNPAFICDVHLGRLCKYLRMFGFDTLYSNQYNHPQIIERSQNEKRILLSRSRLLTRHKAVTHAIWIQSSDPLEQLKELTHKMDLINQINPFTRCLNCNSKLIRVEKQEVVDHLQESTTKYYHEFFRCPQCEQLYWKGSHYDRMLEFIHQIAKQ